MTLQTLGYIFLKGSLANHYYIYLFLALLWLLTNTHNQRADPPLFPACSVAVLIHFAAGLELGIESLKTQCMIESQKVGSECAFRL